MEHNFFSNQLILWFSKNKRDLPWRNTQNPYKIWLSEVILQQTRVAQGLPYYQRFIEKYPTVQELAKASEEEVLKLWQGLGYYSRARNMLKTAQLVVSNGNTFPDSYSSLIQLKGIGPYTASAIASFSSHEHVAVVDGNVYRVLSRVFGILTPIDSSQGKKEFQNLADSLLPMSESHVYNQAIMEFGALQCMPKSPNCTACPLNSICFAQQNDQVKSLPFKAKKTKKKKIHLNYLVIHLNSNIIVRQRKGLGIWEGLYDFPSIESPNAIGEKEILRHLQEKNIHPTKVILPKKKLKHVLSHIEFEVLFWEIETDQPDHSFDSGYELIDKQELSKLPTSRLIENYIESELTYPY